MGSEIRLDRYTSPELAALLAEGPLICLLPVGSVEPHGPHLPLATDALISQGCAREAVALLAERGVRALIAPTVPYGVTDFAAGFAGAVSVPHAALVAWLGAVVDALLAAGFHRVCLVNNHLEPEQDGALREVVAHRPAVVLASPLTRRWARTLSAEFKSGACHAGRYETSIIQAEEPGSVREELRSGLPALDISLATAIRGGERSFAAIGMEQAYTGAPAEATPEEGRAQRRLLAEMVVGEVLGALG